MTIDDIRAAREKLGLLVRETPVWTWQSDTAKKLLADTEVHLKLELFQYGGSFKARGALTVMSDLNPEVLRRGVTTVSAGNHAIATGYAAKVMGTTAKVVMPKTANPARIARSRALGAEVILVDDVHKAFDEVHRIEREEGRTFVHPFEGPLTALGTATLGLEFCQQSANLDAIIVPIGGGGLCAGIATAVKLAQPDCLVLGVEPVGAQTMHLSFASGKPEAIDRVETIADSLGAPHAAPYTFSLCQRFVDDLVLVDDDALCRTLALMFHELKLAVEPAGASALAALIGPLQERLANKRVGIVVCGSNIDTANYTEYLRRGEALLSPAN